MKKLLVCTLGFSLFMSVLVYAEVNEINDSVLEGVVEYVNINYVNLSDKDKQSLIDSLYYERINHNTNALILRNQQQELENAYENMLDEENYIVSLINDLGGVATFSSWKENLDFLKENYTVLSDDLEVDM